MAHGHLLHSSVLQENECGQEAVHSREERNAACIVGVHHFQRTACVPYAIVGHHVAETVGNARLKLLEERIFAVGTYAGNEFELIDEGEEHVKIFRSRLQVGIHVSHVCRLAVVDSGFQGGTQSAVLRQGEEEEVTVSLAHRLDAWQTVVL